MLDETAKLSDDGGWRMEKQRVEVVRKIHCNEEDASCWEKEGAPSQRVLVVRQLPGRERCDGENGRRQQQFIFTAATRQ